nr:MAG TPA: hypothetical protein [Caudoviricetes sp.]
MIINSLYRYFSIIIHVSFLILLFLFLVLILIYNNLIVFATVF